MTKKIGYYVHFHKKFPFNFSSEWCKATHFEKDLDIGGPSICLSDFSENISNLFAAEAVNQERVGYLAQTIAAEYWILHNVHDVDYVGVTGYRRYAEFAKTPDRKTRAIRNEQVNDRFLAELTGRSAREAIEQVMAVHDVIVPKSMYFGQTISEQYLNSNQLEPVWGAFLEGIAQTTPEYKDKLNWFDLHQPSHFFGPMGMNPIGLFKEYADAYLKVVKFVLENTADPFHVLDWGNQNRSDRWMGFLAERFYPFFLYANRISKFEVPVVLFREAKFGALGKALRIWK